jgi:2-hydroxy-3-oxopropionate reductase
MRIGFIGLGISGKPMVKNLLKAGHEVLAYDLFDKNIANVVKAGAIGKSNIAEIASQCPMVITMLPNSPRSRKSFSG